MKKWVKNIKLMIAVSTMMAMFAIAPVVHGGITWSGIDPIFLVKGHQFNVIIKWPEQYTCSIEDPIKVKIRVPEDSSYVFISESSDDVGDCGSPQRTITKVKFGGKGGEVKVTGRRINDDLRISIRNPVAPNRARKKEGNKMAMANIRQRFELAYGSRATVNVEETDSEYKVQLQFPCEESTT